MENAIAKIAERVLGCYFGANDVEIRTGKNGTDVFIYTCVKAYGAGGRAEYDSAYPDEREWDVRGIEEGPALAAEIMRKYPAVSRVSVCIDSD